MVTIANFFYRIERWASVRNNWVRLNNWIIVFTLGVILVILAAVCLVNAQW